MTGDELQNLEFVKESSHKHTGNGCCSPKDSSTTVIPMTEPQTIWEAAQHGNLKRITG